MANVTDVYRRTDAVMQVLEDRTTLGVLYIGITPLFSTLTSEAHWQIQRTTFDASGNMTTTFANDAKYNCVWDNKASYFPAPPGTGQAFPGEGAASDVANTSCINAQFPVTVSQEAKVGVARMSGRKVLTLQPLNGKIWWGYNTPCTNANSSPLYKDDLLSLPVGGDIPVYIIADVGSVNVAISEMK
jgi:hypothetical protein